MGIVYPPLEKCDRKTREENGKFGED